MVHHVDKLMDVEVRMSLLNYPCFPVRIHASAQKRFCDFPFPQACFTPLGLCRSLLMTVTGVLSSGSPRSYIRVSNPFSNSSEVTKPGLLMPS